MVDYYLVRRTELDVKALYEDHGPYRYRSGWNAVAVVAFVLGVAPNIPGFLNAAFPAAFPGVGEVFKQIYAYAWFIGLAIAAVVYRLGMSGQMRAAPAALRSA